MTELVLQQVQVLGKDSHKVQIKNIPWLLKYEDKLIK